MEGFRSLRESWIHLCTLFPKNLAKKFFHKQRLFQDQGPFPRSRTFFTTRDFSTIKKVFHKQRFFHDQGTFRWSGRFSSSKSFPLIREVFHKKRFSTSKDFTSIQFEAVGKNVLTLLFLIITKCNLYLHKQGVFNCRFA